MAQRIIYWFRNDLRLHDNEAFFHATSLGQEIVPVYVFDPRQFETTKLGFRRTNALRAQFILEAVSDLRNRLREKGGDLLIRIGEPEKIVPKMAEDFGAEYVYTSKEIGPEETRIESSLSKNLKLINIDIKLFWLDTLVHAVDLPFKISKLPSNFQDFYAQIEHVLIVKDTIPEPEKVTLPQDFDGGTLPTLPTLGIDPEEIINPEPKAGQKYFGETCARSAFEAFLENELNKPLAENISDVLTDCHLSQWLSLGCLSAREIHNRVKANSNSETGDLLIKDLLRRDYFHWILLRYGPRIFKPSGIRHDFSTRWANDPAMLDTWIKGQTDREDVNLIMQKLTRTGILSFEERRIAAEYLVHGLGINWILGAMFFESCLLDYEASVNWGRWNNVAGVGEH